MIPINEKKNSEGNESMEHMGRNAYRKKIIIDLGLGLHLLKLKSLNQILTTYWDLTRMGSSHVTGVTRQHQSIKFGYSLSWCI